ncbi:MULTISPECIES: transposase [unclassified Marinobacterium]|uniref:transposase n=1 Tax=unclassified Marinobacterium TaxID=2644139 RepID=UPI001569E86B
MPQHIIHRGHNRQYIFKASADFEMYLSKLEYWSEVYEVQLHAWVLMSNHIHFLLTPSSDDGISEMMKRIAGSYGRYFNKRYGLTGTIWEGRYKNMPVVNQSHLDQIKAYIEQNPVRAGICGMPSEYRWSSGNSGKR